MVRGPVAPRPATPTRKVTIPAAVAPLLLEFPSLDARLWSLAIARLVVTAGFSAVMPFLAMHLAVDRQVPVVGIGLLWTLVGACSAAAQWLAGEVADRLGRRPVMLAGMILRSLNLAALGYAVGARAGIPVIASLCVLNGMMRAFYDPIASAVVASLSAPEERLAAFSLHRVGSSLGWVLGPLVATLASEAAYHLLFWVAAPVTLLAAGLVAFIPETRPAAPRANIRLRELLSLRAFRRDPTFLRFLGGTFTFFLLQTQMYHMLSIYAAKHIGLDRGHVGSLFALNGILVVLLQLPAVRLIRYIGTSGALVLGCLGFFASYIACGLAVDYLSLLACFGVLTLCEIIALPAQQTAVTALAPPERVAPYAGMFGLVQGAAQTAGPLLGTMLLDWVSPRGAWFVLSSLGLVALVLYRRLPAATGTFARS